MRGVASKAEVLMLLRQDWVSRHNSLVCFQQSGLCCRPLHMPINTAVRFCMYQVISLLPWTKSAKVDDGNMCCIWSNLSFWDCVQIEHSHTSITEKASNKIQRRKFPSRPILCDMKKVEMSYLMMEKMWWNQQRWHHRETEKNQREAVCIYKKISKLRFFCLSEICNPKVGKSNFKHW